MRKKLKISPEELALFHEAVAGTKPLSAKKHRHPLAAKTKKPSKQTTTKKTLAPFLETHDIAPVSGEELISYKHNSISHKILRNLRKGQYNVEAVLDLHGMSVDEAQLAVDRFLQQCLHEKMQVILIIHGKGRHSKMPILKNKLNHWLREINVVLAFCSAAPSHGNRGAIYVLLKRTAEENFV